MADTTKAAKAAEGSAALKVHHLRPAPGAKSAKIRVGRGEGGRRGKTAGRGTKGTKARYQVPVGFQGGTTPLHMRFPKLRGFKNPFKTEYQVVNLEWLNAHYPAGWRREHRGPGRQGRSPRRAPREGARQRRDHGGRQRHGQRVLRQRQGEDRGGGRFGDHRLTPTHDHVPQGRFPGFLGNLPCGTRR